MHKVLMASIFSALLLLVAVGLFAFLFHESAANSNEKSLQSTLLKPAIEDCQLIESKINKLRHLPSGGTCDSFNGCAMVDQSCSAIPKTKASQANMGFDRLLSKAKEKNCNVAYLICEFVQAACRENVCVVERATFDRPDLPRL